MYKIRKKLHLTRPFEYDIFIANVTYNHLAFVIAFLDFYFPADQFNQRRGHAHRELLNVIYEALFIAIRNHNVVIVNVLLTIVGISIEKQVIENKSAFQLALELNHDETVKALLYFQEHKKPMVSSIDFLIAAARGYPIIINEYLRLHEHNYAALNVQVPPDIEKLHYPSQGNLLRKVYFKKSLTALMLALVNNQKSVIELLLSAHLIDPNVDSYFIAGIQQWLSIRGEKKSNPFLLVLHGGPGASMMPYARIFDPLATHYNIVQWDQRGTGKTF